MCIITQIERLKKALGFARLQNNMGTMSLQQPKVWRPDRPVSKGATAYHDAVIDAPYYKENVQELVNIVRKRIKEKNVARLVISGLWPSGLGSESSSCIIKSVQ